MLEASALPGMDVDPQPQPAQSYQAVRLALAVAIVKSRGGADRGGIAAKKRLKDEISLLRSEIERLRSSSAEPLVPRVLCKCFTDSSTPPPRRQRNILAQPEFHEESVARLMDCVRFLNGCKKRRLLDAGNQEQDEERARRLTEMANLIVELVSSTNVQLFSVWLHQAVDFFESCVSSIGGERFSTAAQSATKRLVGSLVGKVMSFTDSAEKSKDEALKLDHRPFIEKVLLHLAEVPCIGHRILTDVSGQLAVIAEALSQARDPFAEETTQLLENSYFLLELISKVLDFPFTGWLEKSKLDPDLLEEFVAEFFRTKEATLRSNRLNFLFVAYTDRICAQVVKQLHSVSSSPQCKDVKLQKIVASSLQRLLDLASLSFHSAKRSNQ
ncbi:protein MULTIPOLAR SPINDLE 1 [Selaginella moellendorffii]|uniref:protein MULTIPOLAR SPINDLE 1 n=1 Tax=Selaginella moellendorffii TaxID=88036 RepID=UPI000D1C27F0|nr:protein MULTIPOLAR SPINDLE 1 [Selaginella moellendorffii]|eukprot:XP_024539855.1 protein MULTIPOLAR SPINDLE 1 [Selaginella moellendorffii]